MKEIQKLPEVLAEYRLIGDMLSESGGVITDEIQAMMDKVAESTEQKLDYYAEMITFIEGDIAYLQSTINQRTERKGMLNNAIGSFRDRAFMLLLETERDKIKTTIHTFSYQKRQTFGFDDSLLTADEKEEMIINKQGKWLFIPDKDIFKKLHKDTPAEDLPRWITRKTGKTIRIG